MRKLLHRAKGQGFSSVTPEPDLAFWIKLVGQYPPAAAYASIGETRPGCAQISIEAPILLSSRSSVISYYSGGCCRHRELNRGAFTCWATKNFGALSLRVMQFRRTTQATYFTPTTSSRTANLRTLMVTNW